MNWKESRKVQNEYLLLQVFAKVLNINNYDSNGLLKTEQSLTKIELGAMEELGLDSPQSVVDYIESLKKTNNSRHNRRSRTKDFRN